MRQRNLSDQIRELQSRLDPQLRRGYGWPIHHRIEELYRALDAISPNAHELLRHFPVAAVAILESYLKGVVAAVIDHGPEYLERGLKLIGDRALKVPEALSIIQSRTATPGQLIAHFIPCSSVSHLEEPLDAVLGFNVKQRMKTAIPVAAVRSQIENPLLAVDDVPALWQKLAQLFTHRHVLAHEAAMGYVIAVDQANASIEAVQQFMLGVDAVLWATIWADVPLTQREMTDKAWRDMGAARKRLADLLRSLRKTARLNRRRHSIWRTYFLQYMEGYADEQMGSIRGLVYFRRATDILMDRIRHLEPFQDEHHIG